MGKAKEIMIERQQERFNRNLAVLLLITYNELLKLEYVITPVINNDGIVVNYIIEFSVNSPRYILNKITGIDENNQFWFSPYDIIDEEYND